MQRILSSQLSAHVGQTVRVAGWVHRRRLLKSVAFLILRDAAGLAQVVVTDAGTRAQLEALPEETTVAVVGAVTGEPSAPGGVEITSPVIEALTDPAEPAPFDLYRPDLRASLPNGTRPRAGRTAPSKARGGASYQRGSVRWFPEGTR